MDAPRLKEHELKCWPEYFAAHLTGHKNFEIRDTVLDTYSKRDFRVGDLLVLREFVPCRVCAGSGRVQAPYERAGEACDCMATDRPKGAYTGRSLKRLILYVTDFGQKAGTVVMALKEWRESTASVGECPSPERVDALTDHVASLGAYTQAREIEAMGAAIQSLLEEREHLLREVERHKSTEELTYRAAEREYHRLRDLLRQARARMTALIGRDALAEEVDEEITRAPIKTYSQTGTDGART